VAQIPRLEPALALDPSSVTEQATVMVMRKSWKQWSGVSTGADRSLLMH
jgi:hypothetical protein